MWRKIYDIYIVPFWIIVTFGFWVFALKGFLTLQFLPTGDATSYLEHTKYFIENMARGKLPLWDPFWYQGVPNDFFLRRIGIFNPFYSIIILLESLGLPYVLAWVWFWMGYYLSGMIAFYLLSMRLFNNRFIAYAGYLLLLFSASTVRLFNSFEMLITIPIIWFFYFLVAFSQTPRKQFFLGMVLFFIILASTYIPFYFLTFFVLFLFLFSLFYAREIPIIISRYAGFFRVNKVLVIISLGVVFLSFLPGAVLMCHSFKQEIVLPLRHGDSSSQIAFSVPPSTLQWSVVEELLDSFCFWDLKPKGSLNVYVPFFACVIFGLGLFCRISRLSIFLLVCALSLICIFLPSGPPIYDFLYNHVFFFKTFRNFHFFIWFVLVPIYILFASEHWRMFESSLLKNSEKNKYFLLYVLIIHVLVFIYFWSIGDDKWGSYLMVILSFVFWSLLIQRRLHSDTWKFVLLTAAILAQPMDIYSSFFHSLTPPYHGPVGSYDMAFNKLRFEDPIFLNDKIPSEKATLYYTTASFNALFQNIDNKILNRYLRNKFIFVDHLQPVTRHNIDFNSLGKHFIREDNLAFIFGDASGALKTNSIDPSPDVKMQRISNEGSSFRVLSFDANDLKLAVNIPYEKFLVYNDSYDSYWRATVNGRATPIYQTNIAFKGIWVPQGKSIIEFHYGFWWQYVLNIFLLAASFILFFGLVWFCIKSQVLEGKS